MNNDMVPVRILVVDDDAVSREVIALHLAQAGYAVETAESGDSALLRLGAAGLQPAVVLTDLHMPGIAGAELGRRMRGLCGTGTLLLAMSGSEPEGSVRRAFDGFLPKPFTMEALATVIAGAVAEESGRASHDAHLIDDETVAKMGHPGSVASSETAALDEGVYRKLVGAMRRESLERLYALCLSDAEARIAGMRRSASEGDDAAYRREAHAIKGGCGMVGATELQRFATLMEERGLDNANHVASLDEFILACERLRRILIAHASEWKDPEAQGEHAR
jgi:CheY-like chemotaxis protein